MRIQHESIIIESSIPIGHISELEMNDRLNEHGRLNLNVIIDPEMHSVFLQSVYLGENIQFLADLESGSELVFSGKIRNVTYEYRKDVIRASIGAMSYSVELDEEKKRRSFQDIGMSFGSLLDIVIGKVGARFNWQAGGDKDLGKPFIQYDETDWEFAKRLASYFNRPIHVSLLSECADFYFGVRSGVGREIDEATISEQGVSDFYYTNGGYENNVSRGEYYYLKARHREPWQIGDFAWYRSRKLIVIETQAVFERGELIFVHTLGGEGYIHRRIVYSDHLIGLGLQGEIRRVEKESIEVQLDIDHDEQVDYLWDWAPEVGNLNYLMPEVGSRVVLTFSTNDEEDGRATHLLRTNSDSGVYEDIDNKQIVTAEDKTIGLYPEKLLLAGVGQGVSVELGDQEGIRLESDKSIRMRASKEIQLRGEKVTVLAPSQILLQTSESNIDIATNFNFFAPGGVKSSSELPCQAPERTQAVGDDTDQNHWPLSYCAIGALPKSTGADMGQNTIVNSARGVLPKMIGGQAAIAMSEMMDGANASDTSHPGVFSSMGSFSMKGGSRVPKEETEDAD